MGDFFEAMNLAFKVMYDAIEFTPEDIEKLAQVFYKAYGDHAEWKNYQGLPMPTWDNLPTAIKDHHKAGIQSILDFDFDFD